MFSSDNSALIGGIGLILSAVGLAVSLLGFGTTLFQLRGTKRATEAVETEVSRLKNRMAVFDYSSECIRATKSLEHSVQLLRSGEWSDAAGRLLEAQLILNRIASNTEGSDNIRHESKNISDYLLKSIQDLEDASDKNINYSPRSLTMTIRKHINYLDTEIVSIHRDL